MPTETIIYTIIAGIAALLLALFQYIYKSKKGKLYKLFFILRFFTYFLILLLIINPKFEKLTVYTEKPKLIFAIDDSESINHLEQTNNLSQILDQLDTSVSLNEKFDIDQYTFGNTVLPLDSLSQSQSQTNISGLFKSLSEIYRSEIAPVILITDGNQTYGTDYEYSSSQFKQAVFPIVLGDTLSYSDLKIQQLNVNKYAYLKNKFPVEIIALYDGKEDINTQLIITSGGSTVYRQALSFSPTDRSKIVNIELPADRVGVSSYSATLVPLDSEKNKINNQKPFAVEVIDQKTNVALVSDIIHPDLGSIKKAIESNEQRSVTILKPQDYVNVADNYQLTILYQPNSSFDIVYEVLNNLGKNRFTITGPQTQWSFLNTIQDHYIQEVTGQTEDFQPELNTNYNVFIVDDLDFDSFPPIRSEFGEVTFKIPFQTLLYKRVSGIATDQIMMATFENSGIREAVLFGENIWKWRAQSYLNHQSFQKYDNLIGKIVQYLASNKRRDRLNLNYESFYNGNGEIVITAQFFNKNYEFENNASLNITLTNTETEESTTVPFILKQNKYEVDLSGFKPSEYNFTVSANGGEVSRTGKIRILEFNVEQQFVSANVNKLQKVVENTSGKLFYPDKISNLIDEITVDDRFVALQKSHKKIVPLIDFKLLLALIVLSLTIEWFLRKYNGLI